MPVWSAAYWEHMHAPYDSQTYQAALIHIHPNDVVLDIGAGDLRFARQVAAIATKVIAIEINPTLLDRAMHAGPMPANLITICADAQTWDFPPGITTGVLLMRHCLHFRQYAEKLRTSGAQRLITNARWRMGVDVVELRPEARLPYASLEMGAYACWCGAVGFKPGPVEILTPALLETTYEVVDCPHCLSNE
ncbi:MAG: hypothetical protein Fur0016_18390 [Anaerolineales bacterium]